MQDNFLPSDLQYSADFVSKLKIPAGTQTCNLETSKQDKCYWHLVFRAEQVLQALKAFCRNPSEKLVETDKNTLWNLRKKMSQHFCKEKGYIFSCIPQFHTSKEGWICNFMAFLLSSEKWSLKRSTRKAASRANAIGASRAAHLPAATLSHPSPPLQTLNGICPWTEFCCSWDSPAAALQRVDALPASISQRKHCGEPHTGVSFFARGQWMRP